MRIKRQSHSDNVTIKKKQQLEMVRLKKKKRLFKGNPLIIATDICKYLEIDLCQVHMWPMEKGF